MARIRVLDPTAPPPQSEAKRGPDAGAIAGQLIGIRYDQTWQSFFHVKHEWGGALEAAGARTLEWDARNRIGEEGEQTRRALERFASDVDVAVVGLGN
jgi:hypothetical protein